MLHGKDYEQNVFKLAGEFSKSVFIEKNTLTTQAAIQQHFMKPLEDGDF